MASSIIQLPKLILKVAGILLTTISPVLADSADTKNEKDGGFYFTLGVGTHHLQKELVSVVSSKYDAASLETR